MSVEKTITIGGKEMRMRASALIPRFYRYKFGRDMMADINRLKKNFDAAVKAQNATTEEEIQTARLDVMDLTIFENVAWLMLRHAGEEVGETPDEWLDSLNGLFPVYEVLPEILELWDENLVTTSTPRKK